MAFPYPVRIITTTIQVVASVQKSIKYEPSLENNSLFLRIWFVFSLSFLKSNQSRRRLKSSRLKIKARCIALKLPFHAIDFSVSRDLLTD